MRPTALAPPATAPNETPARRTLLRARPPAGQHRNVRALRVSAASWVSAIPAACLRLSGTSENASVPRSGSSVPQYGEAVKDAGMIDSHARKPAEIHTRNPGVDVAVGSGQT